jgi:hypothetical protein
MKKFIALFIVLAVLAPVAFAQDAGITFGGWGRGIFAPIQVVDPDEGDSATYAGVGKNWAPYPRVGFSVIGNAKYAGFQADLFVLEGGFTASIEGAPSTVSVTETGKGVPVGDNAFIWVKPWDFLKVSIGKFHDNTLRGKFGDGNFDAGVTLGMYAEDQIFTRFRADSGLGAEVALTPIEGLYIGALVNAGEFQGENLVEAKYVYEKIQVGAGYEIPNIGHARAQFVGGDGRVDEGGTAPRVVLAFALTAVENLLVDLGAKIWFPATKVLDGATDDPFDTTDAANGRSVTKPINISVGAQYDLDAFSIYGRIDTAIGGVDKDDDKETTTGFALNAHLIPSYNLGFATVGAEIGLQINPEITSKNGSSVTLDEGGLEVGLGLWIQKDVGNGLIKTGFGVQLPTEDHKPPTGATKSDLVFTIPVILEYSF